jgi:acyl dehydratase
MPTVDLSVLGRRTPTVVFEYDTNDVILYALSVGAQPEDLSLVYDRAPGGLQVLPSFCLVAGLALRPHMPENIEGFKRMGAGEDIRLHRPLPPRGRIRVTGEVTDIFDKGKLAVIVTRTTGTSEEDAPLFEADSSVVLLDGGGFGGPRGPASEAAEPPHRPPDFSVIYAIPQTQAVLYQLNGVDDPLHVDPVVARDHGFDRPVLHGPCTFGYAARAIVAHLCAGDVSRFKSFAARFSGVVFPGEDLTVEAWGENRGYVVRARTPRGVVLSHARADVEPAPP